MIIGHSSGCAIANDGAKAALDLNAKIFSLISLDGFRPSPELLSLPGTTVWSAKCNGARSLNCDALNSCKQFRVYNPKVTGQWPLHFALVDLNVSDDYNQITDDYDQITDGYGPARRIPRCSVSDKAMRSDLDMVVQTIF